MKKDFKRLYTYGLIMIVCVIIIVIFAWLSSTKLESSQADYEDKLMQNRTQIEDLEKRIADLEDEKYKLEKEVKKNTDAQAKLDVANQALNDLTEVFKLIEAGDLDTAKEKFGKIETGGFDDAALAFYGALNSILNK